MLYRISLILLTLTCLFCFSTGSYAQEANVEENDNPVILYSGTPKKYEIGGIKVEGVKNYEDYVLIGLSGLSVGQTIVVPGDDITTAVKRYWRHGLFSDVQILAEKIVGDKIYLKIILAQRPRIADIRYHGVKKSEREDLEAKLGLVKGSQITPNLIDRAKILIKKHFDEKGFKNAEVTIVERDLADNKDQVDVDVMIDKKEKVKVHKITIDGNTVNAVRPIKLWEGTASGTVTITNNKFNMSNFADATGSDVYKNVAVMFCHSTLNNVEISGNTVTGSATGFVCFYDSTDHYPTMIDGATFKIHDNTLNGTKESVLWKTATEWAPDYVTK